MEEAKKADEAPTVELDFEEKVNTDKLVAWVLEYCESQSKGVFHMNPVYQREDGTRYAEKPLFGNGFRQLVIIPEGRKDFFDKAMNFGEKYIGKGKTLLEIIDLVKKEFPEKCLWSSRGLNVDLDELLIVEVKENPVLIGLRVPNGEPMYNVNNKEGFIATLSDQELWDELKRRGYTVEDNRLVVVKRVYLS